MRDRIVITKADSERLHQFLQRREERRSTDFEYLDALEEELDRAEVVEAEAIPRDVITMNSEVRLRDLDSGKVTVYKLIFPTQTPTPNSVSILAPRTTSS